MSVNTDPQKIKEILERGIVVNILPTKEELTKRLCSGERLRIYIGADPTSNALHLSHAKNYMFLEELRKLGHEVIILFGDFTAQIGDPTGRSDTRPQLSDEQVKENVTEWVDQIKPLMDFDDAENPPRILFNSEWLSKLTFKDVVSLAAQFTVQQMMERDMFEKRLENNTPIHLHEFLYPLMQGYDSVAMDVDIELCGTDQTFNALAGRTLMKRLKDKDKMVLVVNLMANPKTGELMSKSRGTGVFLSLSANEMFGAIMAQPDEMTEIFFINNTRVPLNEIKNILAEGPLQAKQRVAFEIVKVFHGEDKASDAKDAFASTFQKKEVPDDIDEIVREGGESYADALVRREVVASKSELTRLLKAGGVRDAVSGEKYDALPEIPGATLKIGKRRFVKLV